MDVIKERIPIETPAADVMSAAVAEVDMMVPENTRVGKVLCCPTRLMDLSAETVNGAVNFSGTVEFGVLYTDEEGQAAVLTAQSPFKHSLAAPAAVPGMMVDTRCNVAPASVTVGHSILKLEAVVEMEASVMGAEEISCVADLGGGDVAYRTGSVEWSRRTGRGSGSVTLREDVELPPGLPDIDTVLWPTARAVVDYAMARRDEAQVTGTLMLSVLYKSGDTMVPIQTVDFEIPFSAPLAVPGLREETDLSVMVQPSDLLLRPCEDIAGNVRVLSVETPLSIRVTGWEQGTQQVLTDAYGLTADVKLIRQATEESSAPSEMNIQTVVSGGWTPDEPLPLGMRIIHSAIEPVVDIAEAACDGLKVSGRLRCRVMYIDGESDALCCSQGEAPFDCTLDLPGITDTMRLMVWADGTQASVSRSGEGFAVQAGLAVRVMARNVQSVEIVADAEMGEAWDTEKMAPLILVVAGPDDSVWTLARECRVSVDTLLSFNPQLAEREVQCGERITILR